LTHPGYLNKGEFEELGRTLQEEKVIFKVLCIPFIKINLKIFGFVLIQKVVFIRYKLLAKIENFENN
jgi:hypothetical protein